VPSIMTDWYDMLKSPLFDESSDSACYTGALNGLEESLNPNDEQNHRYDSNFQTIFERFCMYDGSENASEPSRQASVASPLRESPARLSSTYMVGLSYNAFNPEQSWEFYGDRQSMEPAVGLEGRWSTGNEELVQELASGFGNLANLAKPSPPRPISPSKVQRQGSFDCAVVEDGVGDDGIFDNSSPSTGSGNRSDSFAWSSTLSTSSRTSVDCGEDVVKVRNDFQSPSAQRRVKRKRSVKCSDSKHNAQAERTRAANRAAAHRYREKRRAATDALESKVKTLEAEKRSLNSTIGTLHAALLSLRVEASRHCACGGNRILQL